MALAYLVLACRTLVGLVFLAALVGKLRGRAQYREFVTATGRLASGWLRHRVRVGALAAATLAGEAAVVLLLVAPVTVPYGLALAGGLAVVFGIAVVAALARGERGSCNCFGATTRPLGAAQVVRNALLAAGAGLGLVTVLLARGSVDLAGGAVAVIAGGMGALLLVTFDDIVDLFGPVTVPK